MCAICGCEAEHGHQNNGKMNHHYHGHDDHTHADGNGIEESPVRVGAHVPGMARQRMVQIERDILAKNDAYARINRTRLQAEGMFALNFVSSPGSGKTTLLSRTITDLQPAWKIAVIEGDQQTSHDADRIRATGAPAVQINTGKGCHLDAHMVGHALEQLPIQRGGLLFIENVGNLVCPAAFDLGEAHKVVVLSVTEGEDKPIKYPEMFARSALMLLNKVDLLPYIDFDAEACIRFARQVNPSIKILMVSARSGEGLSEFYCWLSEQARAMQSASFAAD